VLLLLFSALTLAASISLLISQRTDAVSSMPAPLWVTYAAGIAIGFLTGFLGVGVGFLIVPTMVFAFACTMQTAVRSRFLSSPSTRLSDWRHVSPRLHRLGVVAFLVGGSPAMLQRACRSAARPAAPGSRFLQSSYYWSASHGVRWVSSPSSEISVPTLSRLSPLA
jgi:hypothetical protein